MASSTKGLLTPQRNGYLYWLERDTDGSISYLNSEGYVPQNVFKSIDPKTGRPDVDLAHKPGTGKAAKFCPGLWGGKDWPFEAYNPKTGNRLHPVERKPLQQHGRQGRAARSRAVVDGYRRSGLALLGRYEGRASSANYRPMTSTPASGFGGIFTPNSMMWGSMLTTAGDLVFGGGTNDRQFRAYDAKTGEELWHFKTNSGVIAPPSTFEVDGVQYIAVASGYGVDPAYQEGSLASCCPVGRLTFPRAA